MSDLDSLRIAIDTLVLSITFLVGFLIAREASLRASTMAQLDTLEAEWRATERSLSRRRSSPLEKWEVLHRSSDKPDLEVEAVRTIIENRASEIAERRDQTSKLVLYAALGMLAVLAVALVRLGAEQGLTVSGDPSVVGAWVMVWNIVPVVALSGVVLIGMVQYRRSRQLVESRLDEMPSRRLMLEMNRLCKVSPGDEEEDETVDTDPEPDDIAVLSRAYPSLALAWRVRIARAGRLGSSADFRSEVWSTGRDMRDLGSRGVPRWARMRLDVILLASDKDCSWLPGQCKQQVCPTPRDVIRARPGDLWHVAAAVTAYLRIASAEWGNAGAADVPLDEASFERLPEAVRLWRNRAYQAVTDWERRPPGRRLVMSGARREDERDFIAKAIAALAFASVGQWDKVRDACRGVAPPSNPSSPIAILCTAARAVEKLEQAETLDPAEEQAIAVVGKCIDDPPGEKLARQVAESFLDCPRST